MHDLSVFVDSMKRISDRIGRIPCCELNKYIESIAEQYEFGTFSKTKPSVSFGFDENGNPGKRYTERFRVNTSRLSGFLSVIVSLHTPETGYNLSFVYNENSFTLRQIYLTIENPYLVKTLGSSFDILEDKKPELFLNDDTISYSILCGETPIVGLPEVVKLCEPITDFVMLLLLSYEDRESGKPIEGTW